MKGRDILNKRERNDLILKRLKEGKSDDEIIEELEKLKIPDFNRTRIQMHIDFVRSFAVVEAY